MQSNRKWTRRRLTYEHNHHTVSMAIRVIPIQGTVSTRPGKISTRLDEDIELVRHEYNQVCM